MLETYCYIASFSLAAVSTIVEMANENCTIYSFFFVVIFILLAKHALLNL